MKVLIKGFNSKEDFRLPVILAQSEAPLRNEMK